MKHRICIAFLLLSFSVSSVFAQVVTREKALATNVINAMGGTTAFRNVPYISWQFFEKRTITWDKWNGDVRIDYLDQPLTIIVNLRADKVMVARDGQRMTDTDSLAYYLDKGRTIWMNDSYWLFMPFKLLDKGVILHYMGKGETVDGKETEVLELTFRQVGATPLNKYHIHIDPGTYDVLQWDYYIRTDEEQPTIITPWTDYKWYGKIRLSSGRGSFGKITNIKLPDSLPAFTFRDPVKPLQGF